MPVQIWLFPGGGSASAPPQQFRSGIGVSLTSSVRRLSLTRPERAKLAKRRSGKSRLGCIFGASHTLWSAWRCGAPSALLPARVALAVDRAD